MNRRQFANVAIQRFLFVYYATPQKMDGGYSAFVVS